MEQKTKNLFSTIKAKLYLSVFIVVLSLLLVSGAAFFETQKMGTAGENIYKISLKAVDTVGKIKSAYQSAQSSIARAPAELDMNKVETLKKHAMENIQNAQAHIEEYKKTVDEDGLIIVSAIEKDLNLMIQSANKIFEFTKLFAADQANKELGGNFKTIEDDVATQMLSLKEYERNRAEESFQSLIGAQNEMYLFISLIVTASILIAGGYSLVNARKIAKRTGILTQNMRILADGDTSVDVDFTKDADEIGSMARAVLVFKENKIEADRLENEQKVQQAKQLNRAKKIDDLTKAFDDEVSTLVKHAHEATHELKSTAEDMKQIAEHAKNESMSISNGTEESAMSVNSVSMASGELSESINKISQQVQYSSEISAQTANEVNVAAEKITGLADSADKIGEILTLIQNIAEQTNLLALNATIEAARAGDAGKGFAVVAAEVKSLANETANATESIAEHITQVQAETRDAVNAVDVISKRITEVEGTAANIAEAVEEQGASTQRISSSVQQAAKGADEVSQNVQQLSEAAHKVGDVANIVLESSSNLSMQNDHLISTVESFLKSIKKT